MRVKVRTVTESNKIETKPYYTVMTDKGMSGWGRAEGKINKLVIGCDTLKEAKHKENIAKLRSEMKYINIRTTKPSYSSWRYVVSYEDGKTFWTQPLEYWAK